MLAEGTEEAFVDFHTAYEDVPPWAVNKADVSAIGHRIHFEMEGQNSHGQKERRLFF